MISAAGLGVTMTGLIPPSSAHPDFVTMRKAVQAEISRTEDQSSPDSTDGATRDPLIFRPWGDRPAC